MIERINLDGSERENILQLSGPSWISSLLIESNRLFWADREMSYLMSFDLSDNDRQTQILAENLNNPNKIAKSGKIF